MQDSAAWLADGQVQGGRNDGLNGRNGARCCRCS